MFLVPWLVAVLGSVALIRLDLNSAHALLAAGLMFMLTFALTLARPRIGPFWALVTTGIVSVTKVGDLLLGSRETGSRPLITLLLCWIALGIGVAGFGAGLHLATWLGLHSAESGNPPERKS